MLLRIVLSHVTLTWAVAKELFTFALKMLLCSATVCNLFTALFFYVSNILGSIVGRWQRGRVGGGKRLELEKLNGTPSPINERTTKIIGST